MVMAPQVRKLALTAHVTASVGWIGALMVFFAHATVSVTSEDAAIVRAACLAMSLTAWFVILPLSIASLTTGVVQALGTAWGLLKHYWVVAKLLLTIVATVVLLSKLAPISALAQAAADMTFSTANVFQSRLSLLIHAAGGLLMLLTAASLAIYKPAGLTRFGRGNSSGARERAAAGDAPRWWKVFRAFAVGVGLLLLIMMFVGGHGPGMHLSAV
jgi:hypothetical protein